MTITIRLFMPIVVVAFLLSSCATNPAGKTESVSLMYIEGVKTHLDGKPALVKEMRGNTAIITLEKPLPYPVGALLKLKIPKKTIARFLIYLFPATQLFGKAKSTINDHTTATRMSLLV